LKTYQKNVLINW